MSDEPVKKCPECGKEVRRLVSGGLGVIFKGSGFYVTDRDKSNVPKGNGSKKDAASSGSSPKADTPSSKGDGASSGGNASSVDSSKADGASSGGSSKETPAAKGKTKPAA